MVKSNSRSTLANSRILRKIHLPVLSDPRLDRNKLRDVTRDAALQDRAVSPNHVLRENLRLIRLRDDCTEKQATRREQLRALLRYFVTQLIRE